MACEVEAAGAGGAPLLEEYEDVTKKKKGRMLKKVLRLGEEGTQPRFEGRVVMEFGAGVDPPTFDDLSRVEFVVGFNQAPNLDLEKVVMSMCRGEQALVLMKKQRPKTPSPSQFHSPSASLIQRMEEQLPVSYDGDDLQNARKSAFDWRYRIQLIEVENPPPVTHEDSLYWADKRKGKANDMFKRQQYSAAKRAYKAALLLVPDDPFNENEEVRKIAVPLHLNIAACLIKQCSWEKVLRHCNAALDMDDTNVKGLFRKGKALSELGRYSEAPVCFQKALQLDPNNSEAKQELRHLELKHKRKPVLDIIERIHEGISEGLHGNPQKVALAAYDLGAHLEAEVEHKEYVGATGTRTTITALGRCRDDAQARRDLLQAVIRCCRDHEDNQDHFGREGGFPVLFDIMRRNIKDPTVIDPCCALMALLSPRPSNQTKIGELGGIPPLVDAAAAYHSTKDHIVLVSNACYALGYLAAIEANVVLIVEAKGCETLVKVVNQHPHEPNLQDISSSALAALSQDKVTAKVLSKLGGILAVLKALRCEPASPARDEQAFRALANMIYHHEDNRKVLTDASIRGLIEKVRERNAGHPGIQRDGHFMLRD